MAGQGEQGDHALPEGDDVRGVPHGQQLVAAPQVGRTCGDHGRRNGGHRPFEVVAGEQWRPQRGGALHDVGIVDGAVA